jgi:hypothetical protein
MSYRKGILVFCGENVEVEFDPNGVSCKEGFRMYDDGHFKNGKIIKSRHPNLLRSVIIGKKSWGLWLNQWTDGIVDWSFTRQEILNIFNEKQIIIPDSFLKDFDNRLEKKKEVRNLKYLEELKMGS